MSVSAAHARLSTRRSLAPRLGGGWARSGGVAPLEYLPFPFIAAVAEEFSRTALLEASEPMVPDERMLKQLWLAAGEPKLDTWHGQVTAWNDWHGISLDASKEYTALKGVIEARNAIVHGLGSLTKRQLGKDLGRNTTTFLNAIGIGISGGRLVVDAAAYFKCLKTSKEFIEWLDLETQRQNVRK